MKDLLIKMKDSKNFVFVLIVSGIVIVCLFIIIFFTFFYSSKVSYPKLRSTMKNAAREYCDDSCDTLFDNTKSITVPAKTLMDKGYMSSFQKITGRDELKCDGNVIINKAKKGYNYIVNLDCGNSYSDTTLYNYIKENNSIVKISNGLYEIGDKLVYRGENVNNHIKIGEYNFRIVKINNDKSITIVLDDYDRKNINVWDDRYNSVARRNDGISDYKISRAKEALDSMLKRSYSSLNSVAISYDYCIGKRSLTDESKDYSTDCSVKYNDYISLLTVNDVMLGSIDDKCVSIENSNACQNYNYLTKYDNSFWLVTASSTLTNKVYYFDNYSIVESRASNRRSLRFVITISGDEIYSSGDGSSKNPYIIK